MPIYNARSIQEYNSEFYRSPANPEGYEFNCAFCLEFFKTKRACISHLKKCCDEHVSGEYAEDLDIYNGFTISDFWNSHNAEKTVVTNYITTNELVNVTHLQPTQIRDLIKGRLINNGYNYGDFNLYVTGYNIYKFFFNVTKVIHITFFHYFRLSFP